MKNIDLKNCPNCNERIGIHDIECPYCKYIDDPKYKKHNEKLKKSKKKNKKNNKYSILLFIPIMFYLISFLFKMDSFAIVLPLILLNIMCFLMKKNLFIWIILIEVVYLIYNLILGIVNINNFNDLLINIIIFVLGIIFIIIPKVIYLVKKKKKKRNKKSKNE